MINQIFLWSMLIVPWFTLFFMPKESIKRYMPVAIFTALITTITSEMGYALKWFDYDDKIVPWGHITNPAYNYGGFLVLTLWIFYFTYRNFWIYFATNIVLNAVQWFFVHRWTFEALGIVQFVNLTRFQAVLIAVAQSLMIYVYHRWQEGIFKESHEPSRDRFRRELNIGGVFGRKKAR